jgi:hypothetical protein
MDPRPIEYLCHSIYNKKSIRNMSKFVFFKTLMLDDDFDLIVDIWSYVTK